MFDTILNAENILIEVSTIVKSISFTGLYGVLMHIVSFFRVFDLAFYKLNFTFNFKLNFKVGVLTHNKTVFLLFPFFSNCLFMI